MYREYFFILRFAFFWRSLFLDSVEFLFQFHFKRRVAWR